MLELKGFFSQVFRLAANMVDPKYMVPRFRILVDESYP